MTVVLRNENYDERGRSKQNTLSAGQSDPYDGLGGLGSEVHYTYKVDESIVDPDTNQPMPFLEFTYADLSWKTASGCTVVTDQTTK